MISREEDEGTFVLYTEQFLFELFFVDRLVHKTIARNKNLARRPQVYVNTGLNQVRR